MSNRKYARVVTVVEIAVLDGRGKHSHWEAWSAFLTRREAQEFMLDSRRNEPFAMFRLVTYGPRSTP